MLITENIETKEIRSLYKNYMEDMRNEDLYMDKKKYSYKKYVFDKIL